LGQHGVGRRLVSLMDKWPTYDFDAYTRQWARDDVPLLMLNGTLDLQTPIEIAVEAKNNLTGANQYFIEVPFANHCVMAASPVKTEDGYACGLQLVLNFFKDPLAQPDTSCIDDLRDVEFEGSEPLARAYMVAKDIFENPPITTACAIEDDFYTPVADSYITATFESTIGDPYSRLSPTFSDAEVVVDGESMTVNDYMTYGYSYSQPMGSPLVIAQMIGGYKALSQTQAEYLITRVIMGQSNLATLKDSGDHITPISELASVDVEKIQEKYSDGDTFSKACKLAVLDEAVSESSAFVCHDNNTAFEIGEPLQFAINVGLSNESAQLGACSCLKNSQTQIDCSVFEAINVSTKKAQRIGFTTARPMPGVPSGGPQDNWFTTHAFKTMHVNSVKK